ERCLGGRASAVLHGRHELLARTRNPARFTWPKGRGFIRRDRDGIAEERRSRNQGSSYRRLSVPESIVRYRSYGCDGGEGEIPRCASAARTDPGSVPNLHARAIIAQTAGPDLGRSALVRPILFAGVGGIAAANARGAGDGAVGV